MASSAVRGTNLGSADAPSKMDGAALSVPTGPTPMVSESQVGPRGLVLLNDTEDPPQLLEEAADILGAPVLIVSPCAVGQVSNKVFSVVAENRAHGWFILREGHYVRLDSGVELLGINAVLREYRFTRQDFNDPAAVFDFLDAVTALYGVRQGMLGSSQGLMRMRDLRTGLSSWLRGTEKSEAAVEALSRDPEFIFQGSKWRVVFSMFRTDGSVDQFTLLGRHDPQADANVLLQIDVTKIRPRGTFSWPLVGGG